ncbi:MAG: hypothetical protein K2X77_26900 [Candidatus Obscuribacterales bacterium]|nr:hypothetical protein [Candidatus Obscuribacterales bacterium]
MSKRKITILILCMFLVAGALAAAIDYFFFDFNNPLYSEKLAGNNALWLRYYFYFGKHNDQDFERMVERLRTHKIKYAYFHVLNTKSNGELHYKLEGGAKKITNAVHSKLPETKAIAWVYVASFGKERNDLEDPEVRRKLVEQARWLTSTCGFDGVQWDYEFCTNGNKGHLELLKETKEALPDIFLSTATPMWYPGTLWGWDSNYFSNVAKYSDQIAVMGYDSWFYLPSIYVRLISQQVVQVCKAAEGSNCKVIIGLPTYEDATLAHHKPVENLRHGLLGVERGVRELSQPNQFEGVALFADYTTDAEEWKLFDEACN